MRALILDAEIISVPVTAPADISYPVLMFAPYAESITVRAVTAQCAVKSTVPVTVPVDISYPVLMYAPYAESIIAPLHVQFVEDTHVIV
ncbi:MAG: hypothetical protein D3914_04210 [Candidatus Electrothrix sp. LOE2]|nr:hypothetical protein [Candidatus Electrothrix sp. LOE2]